MKKTLFSLFILIFLFSEISALCEEGQIDINNASLEELMKITHLGGKGIIAQRVIDNRSFSSVDDLIRVSGIGNKTLEDIKTQGLACVGGEENVVEESQQEEVDIDENTVIEKNIIEDNKIINNQKNQKLTGNEVNTIILTPKDIKSEIDKEELNKNKFAIYGLITFCILLASLFVIKKRKNGKNEFR